MRMEVPRVAQSCVSLKHFVPKVKYILFFKLALIYQNDDEDV